jgi:hypothetical protein
MRVDGHGLILRQPRNDAGPANIAHPSALHSKNSPWATQRATILLQGFLCRRHQLLLALVHMLRHDLCHLVHLGHRLLLRGLNPRTILSAAIRSTELGKVVANLHEWQRTLWLFCRNGSDDYLEWNQRATSTSIRHLTQVYPLDTVRNSRIIFFCYNNAVWYSAMAQSCRDNQTSLHHRFDIDISLILTVARYPIYSKLFFVSPAGLGVGEMASFLW